MKQSTISTKLRAWSLVCLLGMPLLAAAYCPSMGGYASFEAQARAQASQRSMAMQSSSSFQIRDREMMPQSINDSMRQSEQIKADQWKLKALGYYRGDVDGRTSPQLDFSIANFRKAHGLGTGTTFDASSRAVLNGNSAITQSTWEARGPTAISSATGAAGPPVMQTWTDNQARSIQANLLRRDGDTAVLLREDGAVYAVPISTLSRATVSMIQAQSSSSTVAQSQTSTQSAAADRSQLMKDQTDLKRLGYYKGGIDGEVGPGTRAAISQFRRANGFRDGTTLDPASRARLEGNSAVAAAASTPDDDDQILEDQGALAALGFYDGVIDGRVGPQTTAAIIKFKQKHGFDAGNGTLDAKSRAALMDARARVAGR